MLPSNVRWAVPCAAIALCLATAGCGIPSSDDSAGSSEPEPEVEVEEPLTMTVDALGIRHGSLRVEATMLDGSADVEMWLGPSCDAREVGRGIATRNGFTWSLSSDDVARAIECDLVVKAHAIDEDGIRVVRVAPLEVSVSLVPDGAALVSLVGQETDGAETKLTFAAPRHAHRLHIGSTVVGSEETDVADVQPRPRRGFTETFAVDNDDLARAMMHRRRLSVLGDDFFPTVSIGAVTLDVAEPEPEPVEPPVVQVIESESENEG